jgi:hypothetical protein
MKILTLRSALDAAPGRSAEKAARPTSSATAREFGENAGDAARCRSESGKRISSRLTRGNHPLIRILATSDLPPFA